MRTNRRALLHGMGGAVTLPLLESFAAAAGHQKTAPTRFLVVGHPF